MPDWIKRPLLRLLRVPPEPQDPLGGEGTLLVFRAAPGFFYYRIMGWMVKQLITLIGIGVALVALAGAKDQAPEGLAGLLFSLELVGVALVLIQIPFSFLILRLDYEMRWYKVTDRSLRIREGVWVVREMTMTFANVQNVEISQGPLQRLFGIADLRVQSAGGGAAQQQGQQQHAFGMHVGYFRGVGNAGQIRDLVVERLRRYRDTGLGDVDEAGEEASTAAALAAGPEAGAASPVALPGSSGLAATLVELRAEAAALRAAAEAFASSG